MMLGPVLSRLNHEVLRPLIERAYNILARAGQIPPPPPELVGQQLNIEYTSMLARSQRAIRANGLTNFLGMVGQIAQFKPEALMKINALNVVNEYADYFKPYRPDYGGDSGYDGEYEHGDSYGTGIDISRFVSPGTKNNVDLAAYAIQAWENNWGYVWGTFGNVLTESLLEYKIRQYPDGVGNYEDFIRANWLNRRTTDCVGLIKGYGWLDTESLSIQYGTNGMPDYGANQMYQSAVNAGADHGSMSAMPEIVGLAVWKEGHIGVYIGGGYVIEAASTTKGVIKTQVEGRGWQGWCKIPYIDYLEEE